MTEISKVIIVNQVPTSQESGVLYVVNQTPLKIFYQGIEVKGIANESTSLGDFFVETQDGFKYSSGSQEYSLFDASIKGFNQISDNVIEVKGSEFKLQSLTKSGYLTQEFAGFVVSELKMTDVRPDWEVWS